MTNYFVISREANVLATLKNKNRNNILISEYMWQHTNIGTPSTKKEKKRNRGVQQRDNHPTQGYKRIRNYIQMACIINMFKKNITNNF